MLIFIDKPKWITSFWVVRKIKRLFYKEKVWHCWTLDPMATWLLVVWVSKWTKMMNDFLWMDKEYITSIDFSIHTDTRDLDYRDHIKKYDFTNEYVFLNNKKVYAPSIEQFEFQLNKFNPYLEIPLPNFSAKKVCWKKLYELSRKWKLLWMNSVMQINHFKILEYKFPILKIKLNVWSWTYIRSIWYWLWSQFWLWWTIIELKRVKIWKYVLDNIDNY